MEYSRDKSTAFFKTRSLHCGEHILSLENPVVMGILNITPDSFFDGGCYFDEEQYLARAGQMLEEGAAILDIGAVSTRPGAADVSPEEEMRRLIPAVRAIRKAFPDAILSIDTFRSDVARASCDLGAGIINDISAGAFDQELFSVAASYKIPYVLMHMQGTPATMQQMPEYADPVAEIHAFFEMNLKKLRDAGVSEVILDPGFGFGKALSHNYALLRHLDAFCDFHLPLLAGVSRKSMINKLLNIKPEDALHPTGVLNTLALLKGADILRVHDVKEAVQVIKVVSAFRDGSV